MKKNVSRILSVILAICMVVSLLPAVMAVESDDTVEIMLLDTSDIHGQLYATNYTNDYSQSGTHNQGLTRVATYVKEMRAQYENLYLADTGDTIQGTPLTYYFAFEEDTMPDPTVKAMRTMGYDMWVLGNHEFNYGMDILTEQVDYAIADATEGETPITMSMANYLAAETNSDESKDWATWRGFEPYVIKEYDGVKVAIMGIGNPGVPQWDVPANWEGIYFANPVETYDHYEEEMKEKADLIVLMSHSGIDIEGDGTGYIRQLIQTHDSIDLVFSGHEHRDGVTKIADKSGAIIPVISPSSKCSKIGQALITYNKADDTFTIDAKNVTMKSYAIDAELEELLKPYEEATWNNYMLQPIGTASGDFSAKGLGDAPSAFMDLINQVQLHYGYDYNGLNTPDDPSDDQMAQLSISAPLTSGSAANIIPAGDIVLGDLFRLYRYENWFYQITMTGKEVRTWLEFAATNVRADGTASNLTYYDVIYGDGFYYEIDCTAPADSRVVRMTYNGVPVTDDQVFTVVLNNYRF
ncbi:MAG: 5'-nucleotidase C-terminal domain-containing protein, partial [Oscillospiraceae bacterium]|nr:5'-nucleotidase C-terminal domain-containing protein [Oscillospiraceae bacterium]